MLRSKSIGLEGETYPRERQQPARSTYTSQPHLCCAPSGSWSSDRHRPRKCYHSLDMRNVSILPQVEQPILVPSDPSSRIAQTAVRNFRNPDRSRVTHLLWPDGLSETRRSTRCEYVCINVILGAFLSQRLPKPDECEFSSCIVSLPEISEQARDGSGLNDPAEPGAKGGRVSDVSNKRLRFEAFPLLLPEVWPGCPCGLVCPVKMYVHNDIPGKLQWEKQVWHPHVFRSPI